MLPFDSASAIICADEEVSALEAVLRSLEDALDEAKRDLDFKRQELADALAINVDEVTDEMLQQRYPEDVANVAEFEKHISRLKQELREAQWEASEARNVLGRAQAVTNAAYDALDDARQTYDDALEAADRARAALAESLKVDVSQVTDDIVASNVAEAWVNVDGSQAAYDQAKAEYDAAAKAWEDAKTARDAALYALENYNPSDDEHGLPPTGDGAPVVPIALLGLVSLTVLTAARRRQAS